jgi:hypothetical protein
LKDYYYKLDNLLKQSISVNSKQLNNELIYKIHVFKKKHFFVVLQIKLKGRLSSLKNKLIK